MVFRSLVLMAGLGLAAPAWPCTVVGTVSPAELVRNAEVVVRVRALGLSRFTGRPGTQAGSSTQVEFHVLDVLKGLPGGLLVRIDGTLDERDDPNDRPVPYDFVRPGGRRGNCYATSYRTGAEYLLLLRRDPGPVLARRNQLTPYWAPLQPTNEQLFGGQSDPWLAWLRAQLAPAKGN